MTISTKNPADTGTEKSFGTRPARQVLVGIPASPGLVMGRAFQVASREITVVEENIPESRVQAEEQLFRRAVTRTSKEISQIKEISETRTGVHDSLIFSTHLMILQDPGLMNGVLKMIREGHKNARWAVHVVLGDYIDKFEKIDSPAMRDKAADLRDLYNRLMSTMDEAEPALEEVSGEDGAVIVAHEILPSFLMALKPGQARALLMDTGGRTSHVAILARSLQIPAVSGLRNVVTVVKPDDTIIVDGSGGLVIINPNEDDIRKLYRSEFLFLQYSAPTENEQTEAYRQILDTMAPCPVTIRTLDAGGDKLVSGITATNEANPFMGWRSIRVCLDREDIFCTQLKALLKANTKGNLRILLPMISGLEELRRAKACIRRCTEELEAEGFKCATVKVGIMIEVPAAVVLVNLLANEADFFSIGTNDLIQFTLAVDRTNELITDMFQPHHPAVLNMIYQTVNAAHREGIPVAVCGEMGSDPMSVLLLVGLGVDELSMTPWSVMATKKIIRSINFEDVRESALAVLQMDDANSVNGYMYRKYAQTITDLGISSFIGQVGNEVHGDS